MSHPRTKMFRRKKKTKKAREKKPRKPLPPHLHKLGRGAVDLIGIVAGAKFGGPAGVKIARTVIGGVRYNLIKKKTTPMNTISKINGFKTILTAVLVYFSQFAEEITEWVSAHPGQTLSLIPFLMILLRVFTKTPIAKNQSSSVIAYPAEEIVLADDLQGD